MKKSPLNFGGIAAAVGAGTSMSMSGPSANSSQAQNALAQSLSGTTNFSNGVAGVANSMFQQDPSYMAANPDINRTTEGGSGANYSTNSDPAAIYGDGAMGPNSRYTNNNDNITRVLHDNGMNDGPNVTGFNSAMKSRGQVMQEQSFRATNTANSLNQSGSIASSQNFSGPAQSMAMNTYGSPESMDASIAPNELASTGLSSLYNGPLSS